jgi:hypothetical protein
MLLHLQEHSGDGVRALTIPCRCPIPVDLVECSPGSFPTESHRPRPSPCAGALSITSLERRMEPQGLRQAAQPVRRPRFDGTELPTKIYRDLPRASLSRRRSHGESDIDRPGLLFSAGLGLSTVPLTIFCGGSLAPLFWCVAAHEYPLRTQVLGFDEECRAVQSIQARPSPPNRHTRSICMK